MRRTRIPHMIGRLAGAAVLATGLIMATQGTAADASRRVTAAEVEQVVGLGGTLVQCDEDELAAGTAETCAFALGGASATEVGDGVGVIVTRMPLSGASEDLQRAMLDPAAVLPPALALVVGGGERAPVSGVGDWAVRVTDRNDAMQTVTVAAGRGSDLIAVVVVVRPGRNEDATLLGWATAVAALALEG